MMRERQYQASQRREQIPLKLTRLAAWILEPNSGLDRVLPNIYGTRISITVFI